VGEKGEIGKKESPKKELIRKRYEMKESQWSKAKTKKDDEKGDSATALLIHGGKKKT